MLSHECMKAANELSREAHHLLIKVSEGVYACKPVRLPGKKQVINAEITMVEVRECVRLWNKGPPFSVREVTIMTSILIFTIYTCWPCHDFNTKGLCYHIVGLRLRKGLKQVGIPDGQRFVATVFGRRRDQRRRRKSKFKSFYSVNRLEKPVDDVLKREGHYICCFCDKKNFVSSYGLRAHMTRVHNIVKVDESDEDHADSENDRINADLSVSEDDMVPLVGQQTRRAKTKREETSGKRNHTPRRRKTNKSRRSSAGSDSEYFEPDRRFGCDFCNKRYRTSAGLYQHKRRIHYTGLRRERDGKARAHKHDAEHSFASGCDC